MKKFYFLLSLSLFFLIGCNNNSTNTTDTELEYCEYNYNLAYGEIIEVKSLDIPYSDYEGVTDYFISLCSEEGQNLILNESLIKSHQLIFDLESINPIKEIHLTQYLDERISEIELINIDISLNGYSYDRYLTDFAINQDNIIELNNVLARKIKISFRNNDEVYGLENINFILGEGMIIKEETELTNAFLRYKGWTGADGIFSFDLNNGGDRVGQSHRTTGFIFSDTFIGTVYPNNFVRGSSKIINNTFGYLNHDVEFSPEAFSFDYRLENDIPESVLLPDKYLGSRARNLLDSEGLSVSFSKNAKLHNINEGTMYLSDVLESEIVIDFNDVYNLNEIYLWNYNENVNYGTKNFQLLTSLDGETYSLLDSYEMPKASGSSQEGYNKSIILTDISARYLKIKLLEGYDESYIGLGKLMIFDNNDNYLFGQVTANHEIVAPTVNENSGRLWLQDGVVIDDKIYLFPILVKDFESIFKVFNVGMIEMDIVNERFDYENATYYSSPLMSYTDDGGVIYMGAGVMDNRDIDGYIYIYGYKDLEGRHLVVGRLEAEDILNFNEWEYYSENGFVKDLNQVKPLKDKVSAELSVTFIESGVFTNKYMLVVMENTTSGIISYAISDTPYGEFGDYHKIYETNEHNYLRSAFPYNAKLHPALSTEDKLIISYNVNASEISALVDARIYYPRFISITMIRDEGDENE